MPKVLIESIALTAPNQRLNAVVDDESSVVELQLEVTDKVTSLYGIDAATADVLLRMIEVAQSQRGPKKTGR